MPDRREEAQGEMGLCRYRLTLLGGDLFEMFERFQVVEGRVQVTKYSFHWQSGEGQLRKRWGRVPRQQARARLATAT